jgi:GTP-binding protein EngB required for normal cell division
MPALNDLQCQAILIAFLDIHRRLTEMEAALAQGLLDSPFARHVNDLSPTESRVVLDYFERIRQAVRVHVEETGLPLEVRRKSVRWVLQCGLIFLQSAIAELTIDKLAGYGTVSDEGREQAERIQGELRRLIEQTAVYVRQGLGRDLAGRLRHLNATPDVLNQLDMLEGILTRWGLVEFRPLLERIVNRLAQPRFEIAVFGRVNSGKSSLLNHIAGMDVLPVGVVPITAVPTCVLRGERAEAIITLVGPQIRTVPVEELPAYASEEGNPGNRQHVIAIEVHVPSPRLREGVVLVDTPGIGSLATSGRAETFAYLPQCDLGIVLIDAGATINADDLNLLRLLTEASVPVQVLLSKADLLTPPERQQAADYIRAQIFSQLDLDVAVHPVSIVGETEALLTHWFEQAIEPLLERSRALADESLRRKITHLRASVAAVLGTLRQRGRGTLADRRSAAATALWLLDEADEAIRQARQRCRDWTHELPRLGQDIIAEASGAVLGGAATDDPVAGVVRDTMTRRGQTARALMMDLQQTLIETLESLRPMLPLAGSDNAAVRDFVCRGLPPVEVRLPSDLADRVRPWWSALLPRAARWRARRLLRQELQSFLNGELGVYERQVQAWLRNSLAQLIGQYEAQAEVLREQARRLTDAGGDALPDEHALEADLRALREDADTATASTGNGRL